MTLSTSATLAPPSGLSYRTIVTLAIIVLAASSPLCWFAENRYNIDKVTASNLGWTVFIGFYTLMLSLPWLHIRGLEALSQAQRLEKMCIVWLCLTVGPHLVIELPWVAIYPTIMAGKGQLWAYAYWSYYDGGDIRYVTRDVNLLAMETGASIIGIVGAALLILRRRAGKFSDTQLLILMALMVADFYPTYMYYATEIYHGFPSVAGITNLFVKFIGANIFWLIMPWVVFVWAGRQLIARRPA